MQETHLTPAHRSFLEAMKSLVKTEKTDQRAVLSPSFGTTSRHQRCRNQDQWTQSCSRSNYGCSVATKNHPEMEMWTRQTLTRRSWKQHGTPFPEAGERTLKLEKLQAALNDARETTEKQPSDSSVMAHNKSKAAFNRTNCIPLDRVGTTQRLRKIWRRTTRSYGHLQEHSMKTTQEEEKQLFKSTSRHSVRSRRHMSLLTLSH